MKESWEWIKKLKSAILFRFANNVLICAIGIVIAYAFSDLAGEFLNGRMDHLYSLVVRVIIIVLIYSFVIPVLQYKGANLMEKKGGEADILVFRMFLEQNYRVVSEKDIGKYMNVLWSDFPVYRMNLIFMCSFSMSGVFALIVSVGITAYYSLGFALLSLISGALIVLVPFLLRDKLEEKRSGCFEANDDITDALREIFANREYIRLQNRNGIVSHCLEGAQGSYAKAQVEYSRWNLLFTYVMKAVLLLTEVSVYALGCLWIFNGKMDYAIFVKVILLTGVTKNGIEWLVEGIQSIHEMRSAKRRIDSVIAVSAREAKESIKDLQRISTKGLTYDFDENSVQIQYKDLVFEKGNIFRLAGANGAGKSTLMKIMMGFYPDYTGALYLDGKEFRQVDMESWYGQVSYISQNPVLFHMTVKENVLFGNPGADMQRYEQLMANFRLKELEDKMVEFGNGGLSGGEAQSVSIVRALLKNAPILLADEPFNTLDADRKAVLAEYLDQMEDCFVILSSHLDYPGKRKENLREVSIV